MSSNRMKELASQLPKPEFESGENASNLLEKKSLSFDELLLVSSESGWNVGTMIDGFLLLEKSLSFDQVLLFLRKSRWDYDVVYMVLNHMEEELSIEHILLLIEELKKNHSNTKEALAKQYIDAEPTLKDLMGVIYESNWAGQTYGFVKLFLDGEDFKKWEDIQPPKDEVLEVIEAKKSIDAIYKALVKIDENETSLSPEQIIQILKEMDWDEELSDLALSMLEENLDFDLMMDMIEKSEWNPIFISKCILALEHRISFDQLTQFLDKPEDKSDHSFSFLVYIALTSLNEMPDLDQIRQLETLTGISQQQLLDHYL